MNTLAVPTHDGHSVRMYHYRPHTDSLPYEESSALLWIHGGGLVMGNADSTHAFCSELAKELGIHVYSVDYRLAPEHPYPVPFDDCYQALRYIANLTPRKLAIGGDSAGGGLAASVVNKAIDNAVTIDFQLLLYPMLDSLTGTLPGERLWAPLWTAKANRYGWRSYLRKIRQGQRSEEYAVPIARKDFTHHPPTWIGVGTLDLFHRENTEYASKLPGCEYVEISNMYHAADALCPQAQSMQQFRASYLSALRQHLCAPRSE